MFTAFAGPNPYAEPPAAQSASHDPFRWEVPRLRLRAGGAARLVLRLVVPKGFEAYKDQLEVKVLDPAGLKVGTMELPAPEVHPDPLSGASARAYYIAPIELVLPLTAPADLPAGERVLRLDLRRQGCREGLCFSPVTEQVAVQVTIEVSATHEARRQPR